MPRTDEKNPQHWIRFASADLELVDMALQNGVASLAVLSKLVEALEKFLKAFLIHHGWQLKRIHDIEALLQEASGFDPKLGAYVKIVEPLAEAYFEGRYPGFDAEDPSLDELRDVRSQVGPLIEHLKTL